MGTRSHFDQKDKARATGIVDAALFHEITSGFQSIEDDHGTPKDPKVYNVACSFIRSEATDERRRERTVPKILSHSAKHSSWLWNDI